MKIGPVVLGERKPSRQQITLQEVVNRFDIIDAKPTHITVKERENKVKLADTATPDLRELGMSGATSYSAMSATDYNPDLRGHLGLWKYDEMRRNDAQVKAILRLIKTPVTAARWYVEPGGDRPLDKKVANFVWDNLTKWMSTSWPQFLQEALLMLDFGWYAFEKVFALRDGQVIWQKLGPRHPMDHEQWNYDSHGGPNSVTFYTDPLSVETVDIPISKLLVFTFEKEAGNMEGISLLRSAYKHWYYKENLYKVDAIQKERHGIGIPIIKLPAGFKAADRQVADELGRNLRTNEKAHVVLPPNWEIMFAKLEWQPVNAMESIEHHDMMIARSILGQFINNAQATSQEEQQQLFLKATRFIAEIIRDVFNKYAIPELVNYNWSTIDSYPELKVRRIGDQQDWRTISFALRNFVGAGLLVPDDKLDTWIRDEMDLPRADPETARETATPQMPTAGLPRQSPAGGMKQQAQGTGKSNTGTDNSGG